ncbi:MAG: 3-isopropylmalate dehydrogenase [Leptolyngbyaceae cyanobacterium SM1_4_3]|nr:3-isopropylmalate dehydrogenase [Leptolyngbyaceae cyanobacterium SM1_4_3]
MNPISRRYRVVALPGEGIGIEVITAAVMVLEHVAQQQGFSVQIDQALIGQPAREKYGEPFPDITAQSCEGSDGILLGAVSQGGLLELRKRFDCFANLRPIRPFASLSHQSPLKPDPLWSRHFCLCGSWSAASILGHPGRSADAQGDYGYHTMQYHDWEIRRIARIALEKAQQRRKLLTVAHKENALPHLPWTGMVMEEAVKYPDVQIEPMLVDNLAMQLIVKPRYFDVILASNLFGDILSDIGGAIVGSIGLLGSASLNELGFGIYEPVHGTAPDIAGRGIANPLGAINSLVLMLQQWGEHRAGDLIMQAEERVLAQGYGTADLVASKPVTTQNFVKLLLDEITSQSYEL